MGKVACAQLALRSLIYELPRLHGLYLLILLACRPASLMLGIRFCLSTWNFSTVAKAKHVRC